MMRLPEILVLVLGCVCAAEAQTDSTFVTFHFERVGLAVPVYTLRIDADGSGSYAIGDAGTGERLPADARGFRVNHTMVTQMLGLAAESHGLKGCASRAKGVADTGTKTLTYHEAYKTVVTCTYNYTEAKPIMALTSLFVGLAETLDLGQTLKKDQQFDRLGLDRDMSLLVDAVKDGRAQGIEAIAPVLKGIVDDQSLLERVRTRAGKLLVLADAAR